MSTNLKIIIAEPSSIIRSGLEVICKKIAGFRIHVSEVTHAENLVEALRVQRPDVLFVNPLFINGASINHIKEEAGCTDTKCFALVYNAIDPSILRLFDDQIEIFDDTEDVKRKLERLTVQEIVEEVDPEDSQSLSVREKEIVVCVVKGMTNREIADTLYLSTHTVITHRRNIARKLQIHSVSGLTVYAIVNKLVELGDIQPKG